MIITSHMQKIIQIHPCLLKLSRKQESLTDGRYYYIPHQGRIQRGAHPARAPPKIGKNKIFLRKIVIFHTKYPNNFRASLRSTQFF